MTTQWAAGELITASKLNKGLFFRRDTIAALQAVDTSLYTESYYCCYVWDKGIYAHDPGSSATADGYYIVQPTSGGGRWFLISSSGTGQTYADHAALRAVVTSGITYTLYAYVTEFGLYQFMPSSTDVDDGFSVIKPSTGSGRWHLFLPHTDVALGVISQEINAINVLSDRILYNDDGYIYLTASLSWTSIATISVESQTVSCPGAKAGDIVNVGMPELDATNRIGLQWVGVKTDGVITIAVRNNHTSNLTPSTGLWKFEIRRFN